MGPSLAAATPLQVEALVAVEQAQSLLAAGNTAAALELAEQVVAQAPFNVEAHHVIQRVYRSRGDSAGLISRYRGLASRYPGTAAAQYLLGNALLSVESFRTARPGPAAERPLRQALERVRLNIKWLELNRQELTDWFAG